jgi:8-oxo-dGTP pyrophosphatase MutT (NUDIX family)
MADWVKAWSARGSVALRVERSDASGGGTLHRIVVQDGIDGVVVIARAGHRFALVRQPRPAVAEDLWELPRGFGERADVEGGQPAPEAVAIRTAQREIEEELGCGLVGARYLGRIYADSGLLAGAVHVVVGEARGGSGATPGPEVSGVRWAMVEEIDGLIASHALRDGITLAALALWMATTAGGR